MATVDKNFRVKHGLVVANNVEVQGTSLTVNGNEVLTSGLAKKRSEIELLCDMKNG